MPSNPIISGHYRTTKPTDRLVPIMEAHVEDDSNIPYRGSVNHGGPDVSPDYNEELTPEMWNDDTIDPYDPEQRALAPLPVTIVSNSTYTKQRIVMRARVEVLSNGTPGPVANILGNNDARVRTLLKNGSEGRIIISDDRSNCSVMNGYILEANETITLTTQYAVYACALTITEDKLNRVQLIEELTQPL